MKHLFSTFILLILPILVKADDIRIGDFYYSLDAKTNEATIVKPYYDAVTSITIPATVTYSGTTYSVASIDSTAFLKCDFSGLTSISVASSNVTFDSRYGCNAIIEKATNTLVLGCQNTIIPKSVSVIGHHAFYKCTGLTSIVLPNNLKSIGDYAFSGCSNLTTINLPSNMSAIGCYAFSGCEKLDSIDIPEGVRVLEPSTFWNCSSLKSVIIPSNIKKIGTSYAGSFCGGGLVFARCYNLQTLVISEGVELIGERTFYNCINLKSVKIPSTMKYISGWAFMYDSLLTKVEYADIKSLCTMNFYGEAANPLHYSHSLYIDGEKTTDIVVPAGVDSIKNYVFNGLNSMTSLTIGKDVKVLQNIFGDDVTVCPKDIYCHSTEIPIVENTFNNTQIGNITLHVPVSMLEEYESTMPWCDFGEIIPLDEPEQEQCATPVIAFENGQLHFSCDTEGAQFVCRISSPETEIYGSDVDLLYGKKTYTGSVYAKAEGYADSEMVTTTVKLSNVRGDIDGNGFVTIKDVTELIDIYLEKGQ